MPIEVTEKMVEAAAKAIYADSSYQTCVGDDTYISDGPAWNFARAALTVVLPLIAAAEREECAKLADPSVFEVTDAPLTAEDEARIDERAVVAAAIRSRS